jgi:hypothetical protein
MNLKLKIIIASVVLFALVFFLRIFSTGEYKLSFSRLRSPAQENSLKNAVNQFSQTELNLKEQTQLPPAQRDFIKDYEAKTEIKISDDQILLISESVDAIPSHLYQENFGEKVTENFGYIEFRPASIEGELLPVVFNELLQIKGYLTGFLSYIYQSEADKKLIIEKAVFHNGKVISVDQDTQIITVNYSSLEALKSLIKVYPHFEVKVYYAPIVPH